MSTAVSAPLVLEITNLRIWDPERGFIAYRQPMPPVELPLSPIEAIEVPIGDYHIPISLVDDPREDLWQLRIGQRNFLVTPGIRRAYYVETGEVLRDGVNGNGQPIRAVFDLIGG